MIVGQIGALLVFAGSRSGRSTRATHRRDRYAKRGLVVALRDQRLHAAGLGVLIGVFIYSGLESAVDLTEGARDSARAPGLAAVVSTVLLLVTSLAVRSRSSRSTRLERLAEFDDDDGVFSVLAGDALGSPWTSSSCFRS